MGHVPGGSMMMVHHLVTWSSWFSTTGKGVVVTAIEASGIGAAEREFIKCDAI